MTDTYIKTVQFDLNKCSGSTISKKKEFRTKIEVIQQETLPKAMCQSQDICPCNGTLIHCQALIVDSDIASITASVVLKSRTRYTTENLLMLAITAARYDVAIDIKPDHESIMNNIPLEVLKEVKILHRMVGRVYGSGVPIPRVRLDILLSTDATAQYIFEGKGEGIYILDL